MSGCSNHFLQFRRCRSTASSCGWSSNSKYPFLAGASLGGADGELRGLDGFVIITVLLCAGSLNLSSVVEAQNTRGLGGLIGCPG